MFGGLKKAVKKITKASLNITTGGLLGAAGSMLSAGAAQQAGAAKTREYGTQAVSDYVKARKARKAKRKPKVTVQ